MPRHHHSIPSYATVFTFVASEWLVHLIVIENVYRDTVSVTFVRVARVQKFVDTEHILLCGHSRLVRL